MLELCFGVVVGFMKLFLSFLIVLLFFFILWLMFGLLFGEVGLKLLV